MALQLGSDASGIPLALPRNAEGEVLFDGFAVDTENPISATPNDQRSTI
ncbi:hypothetical protein IQ255_16155 [Pleurocapsales cyanobacterium LEGE 10410]|nr:hypothetical protein [Pleurocapsales cyanobacterium LEGE 10410]